MRWTDADTAAARVKLPALEPASLVHLNNAGCSIPSTTTLAAVQDYLQRCDSKCYGPPRPPARSSLPPPLPSRIQCHMMLSTPLHCREATQGGYEVADASADVLKRPYTALAQLINCSPQEIAVVTSATAAWQQVVYGLAWNWKAGDRVRLKRGEYPGMRRSGTGVHQPLPLLATRRRCLPAWLSTAATASRCSSWPRGPGSWCKSSRRRPRATSMLLPWSGSSAMARRRCWCASATSPPAQARAATLGTLAGPPHQHCPRPAAGA
jgi:hypothetical protein